MNDRWEVPWVISALVALVVGCGGPGDRPIVRVGDETVRVAELVQWVQGDEYPATEEGVRRALSDLVQLTLLRRGAEASLGPEEVALREKIIRQQMLIEKLYHQAVELPGRLSTEELRRRYREQGLGEEVRARHLMLYVAPDASDRERDQARKEIEALRRRVLQGEDFAELARRHSDHAADRGGDLGWFGRGDLKPQLEAQVFELAEGQVSPVIETEDGFHLLRVEGRRIRPFEEVQEQVRRRLEAPELQRLSQQFVGSIVEKADLEVRGEGVERLGGILKTGGLDAAPVVRAEPIATAGSKQWTIGDFLDRVRVLTQSAGNRPVRLSPDQLQSAIQSLIRDELLAAEAKRRGLRVGEEDEPESRRRRDQALIGAYLIREALAAADLSPEAMESFYEANREELGDAFPSVEEEIRDRLIARALAPLQNESLREQRMEELANALRETYPVEVHEDRLASAVELLKVSREETQ